MLRARGSPRTKPIGLAAISPNEANDRITKRSQWVSRHDGLRKPARSPAKRFVQTNPLTRYDALSSENGRCSGDEGPSPNEANWVCAAISPNEANDRITKRSQWGSRHDGLRKPARPPAKPFVQTNPLARYDAFSSETAMLREGSPRTKPIGLAAISPNEANDRVTKRSQWGSRHDGLRKPARPPAKPFVQTNPLARYDVFSSEKCRCSADMVHSQTNRHDLGGSPGPMKMAGGQIA